MTKKTKELSHKRKCGKFWLKEMAGNCSVYIHMGCVFCILWFFSCPSGRVKLKPRTTIFVRKDKHKRHHITRDISPLFAIIKSPISTSRFHILHFPPCPQRHSTCATHSACMSEKIETQNALLYFIDAEQMSVVLGAQELLVMSMWRKISWVIPLQIKASALFLFLCVHFYFFVHIYAVLLWGFCEGFQCL